MRKPAKPPAVFSPALNRRQFLAESIGLTAAMAMPLRAALQPSLPVRNSARRSSATPVTAIMGMAWT